MKKSNIFQTTLSNGVQIVGETFDTVQSVSIGFFLKSGVMYEPPKLLGISHFIEHMLFKGTKKRSAKDIARQFDRIGGYLNAFTAKDYCCYYARVVNDKIDVAVDVLSDMVCNSIFDPAEMERERLVIMEEIKMYEDSPDEIIHELLGQNLWRMSPLGNPILGTFQTVGGITREHILKTYEAQYHANNLLIAIAGNFEPAKLIKSLEKALKNLRTGTFKPKTVIPESAHEIVILPKEIEQLHLALGSQGVAYSSPMRFSVTLLNTAFGGGMSSRLFQEIREKRGLAYSVYSYHATFRDTGMFAIYAGLSESNLEQVIELISKECKRIIRSGLTKTELQEAKDQLKGNLLMALESTTNRMNRLITGFLYGVEPQEAEESIKPFFKVTMDDIVEAAHLVLDFDKMAVSIISPSINTESILKKMPIFSKKKISPLMMETKN